MAPSRPTSHPPTPSSPLAAAPATSRPSEEETRHRVTRKLQKKRRDGTHIPTMELPERLRESSDGAEDEEDVRVPPQGVGMSMNLNQSIFGLIAAAGSTVDFNERFEDQSSDEDGDESGGTSDADRAKSRLSMAQTTVLKKQSSESSRSSKSSKHRRKISESRLLRSLPSLTTKLSIHKKSSKGKALQTMEEEEESESPASPPAEESPSLEVTRPEGRLPPVMSRILEAEAEMAARPSFDLDRKPGDRPAESDNDEDSTTALAKKLMGIFHFDSPEEVIEEYPCWLLQSVLLQGYMYITAKHICFYAYLPKKANEVVKSGYLAKSGKRNPKYGRYWFRLKGDVLAYYRDPSNLYFPHGQIDLRYGISASLVGEGEKGKEGQYFQVVTHNRTFHFKADSALSAKEWVKSLQRVIFRSHNDGDSVKISLPIQNIIDIEEVQMLDFADTCKIRVIDNDETYAIDEYYFSFFEYGKEALRVLKILIEDAAQQPGQPKLEIPEPVMEEPAPRRSSTSMSVDRLSPMTPDRMKGARLQDSVRATLSPVSPLGPSPRASGEITRSSFDAFNPFGRRSLDLNQAVKDESLRRSISEGRRSKSRDRLGGKSAQDKHGSSDSYVQSLEDPSQASFSALVASSSDDPSASQILRRSDVFHSPTIRRSVSASRPRDTDESLDRHTVKSPAPGLSAYKNRHAATTGHVADPGAGETSGTASPTTPGLQSLAKMGSYPLQRAGAYADWLNRQGRRMSTLLATESMGYVEKVSGMWKGGRRHYDEPAGLKTDDEMDDADNDKVGTAMDRFRAHFALPATEKLQATYFGYLIRVLPLYGKIYISDRSFCFRSLLPGTRTKLILPLKDVENVTKEKGFRFGYSGLVVVIRGHEELFFEFGQAEARDDCAITLLQNLEAARYLKESGFLGYEEKAHADMALAERDALQEARQDDRPEHTAKLPIQSPLLSEAPTILFDDPRASFLNFKPQRPLRITCLTIGSRGDVQPYIALCKGLLAEGHKVKIATHPEFESWIRGHGIDYGRVEGDPGELMRICIENGTFTFQFLREANSKMRTWLDELLASAWSACEDAELLIESPSAMAGIHIAEALQIPYFRAFTMPWTRTRAYPHAFIMPEHKMGGAYNYITYVMFDTVFWKATASQINRWRNKMLGLPNTTLEKLQPNKVPFLYNFSPSVVPPPLDYSDWIRVTGYWFLDEGTAKTPKGEERKKLAAPPEEPKVPWTPPKELTDFIEKARRDEKKLVYVGFGSILVPDPARMTQEVIDAVLKADVRCILSKGWSDRMVTAKDKERAAQLAAEAGKSKYDSNADQDSAKSAPDNTKVEVPLPPEIHQIKSAPHDWLFAQIDAAAHHGGSGTTGASLRAGIPTIIRPFFGDQFFFGSRVEDLGVGICLKKWGANSFARALWEATHSERMINKARILGEQIRSESGVDTAIQCIYRDLEYAKSLINAKAGKHSSRSDADEDDETEESWTFIGDDIDPMHQSVILNPEGGGPSNKALGSKVLGGKD